MATTDATKQVDAIKSDIDTLREGLSALVKDMSALRGVAAADAATKAAAARDDISEAATEQVEKARNTVKDNPIASVAVAFGLGLLVSRLVR